MSASLYTVRLARPEEIDLLVAIDDDASALYAEVGLALSLAADDPFVVAERERWDAAIAEQRAWIAESAPAGLLAFAICGYVDRAPYLDQLSARRAYMRKGLGRLLLARAIEWRPGSPLWLTTYAHLPWNAPYYERAGFVRIPEAEHGPELRSILSAQRQALPRPEQRIAMRRD